MNTVTCLECAFCSEREEEFYDLILPVKDCGGVEESLMRFLTSETLEGQNQYACSQCNKKVDAIKAPKLRKLPPVLMFSLARFDYDTTTWQRYKINDRFAFPLDIDLSVFQEVPGELERIYELQSVVIHRGSAHSGHYHAYIRDVFNEGKWEVVKPPTDVPEKKEETKESEKKKPETVEPKQDKEEELKQPEKKSEEMKKSNPKRKNVTSKNPGEEEEQIQQESDDHDDSEDDDEEEEDKNDGKNGKKVKKVKTSAGGKGIKKVKRKPTHKSGATQGKKGNTKKHRGNGPDGGKPKETDAVFDEVEFPFPVRNEKLKTNWYDFNDSTVTPILHNRLQKQFGGSAENGYILVYRLKNLKTPERPKIPPYLKKMIEDHNEGIKKEREIYKEAEQSLEIFLAPPEMINVPYYFSALYPNIAILFVV